MMPYTLRSATVAGYTLETIRIAPRDYQTILELPNLGRRVVLARYASALTAGARHADYALQLHLAAHYYACDAAGASNRTPVQP